MEDISKLKITSKIPVVILCGGREIFIENENRKINKALITINSKLLIYWNIQYYLKFGYKNFILVFDFINDETLSILRENFNGFQRKEFIHFYYKKKIIKLNIISTNKKSSTSEKILITKKFLNNKFFAGKEFNVNSPELIKVTSDKVNGLLMNPLTFLYGKLSNIILNKTNPSSYIFQKTDPNKRYIKRYFIQKINVNPILIREINENEYQQFQTNPLYKSITIEWDTIFSNELVIDQAEKQMPGIKSFLQDLNYSPYNEEDIYPTDPNLSID